MNNKPPTGIRYPSFAISTSKWLLSFDTFHIYYIVPIPDVPAAASLRTEPNFAQSVPFSKMVAVIQILQKCDQFYFPSVTMASYMAKTSLSGQGHGEFASCCDSELTPKFVEEISAKIHVDVRSNYAPLLIAWETRF